MDSYRESCDDSIFPIGHCPLWELIRSWYECKRGLAYNSVDARGSGGREREREVTYVCDKRISYTRSYLVYVELGLVLERFDIEIRRGFPHDMIQNSSQPGNHEGSQPRLVVLHGRDLFIEVFAVVLSFRPGLMIGG